MGSLLSLFSWAQLIWFAVANFALLKLKLCTPYYVEMSKPRLLWWCVPEQKYERCSPSFCKKKYSVLIVASPPLRSKMALAAILGLKLALESANVTSKVWPFGLFAKPFFSGVIAGSHLKIPFFFLVTQNLWSLQHTVFENPKTVSFNIASEASYVYILSGKNH